MMGNKNYQYRFIARVVLEAKTPLAIGSGNKEIHTDATVAKDVNGLPYIPGTSIAGVVRHALGLVEKEDTFWGFQSNRKDDKGNNIGCGSEIIFSEAKMIGTESKAIDGLQTLKGDFYEAFKSLPVRQHVRITDKGVGADHGKFDEEIVFKGTRFVFDIEAVSQTDDTTQFKNVLNQLRSAEFRIGAGSRKGFGKMEVVSCRYQIL
ncbi:MAG: CRISPR-associated protein, partial [Bacteroidaceae bacterium]|nr:CRISPR-associated protein [Bacteroidaceae bacterium]